MGFSIIIFILSILSISSVVHLSAIERKDEFIILKTFGLKDKEISNLLVIEIAMLILLSLCISVLISFLLVLVIALTLSVNFFINLPVCMIAFLLSFGCGLLAAVISSKNIQMADVDDI
ncbi:MAG: FtsX-like permease family protein [Breznakia sp.]